jgi:hypothetical protein
MLFFEGVPGESLEINSEKEIFDYLQMDYVPPEDRTA